MADPIAAFNFEVLLAPSGHGGDEAVARAASFSEVSGLEASIDVVALREGGYHGGVRQLTGKVSSPALVLKRGVTHDHGFWQWIQRCFEGRYPLPYVSGAVIVFSADRAPLARWTFRNGICTKVRSGDLQAAGTSVAIEEVHISHEGLVREAP